MPSIEEYDDTNVEALIKHVQQLIIGRPGWSVTRLKHLVERGDLIQTGQKRGTRYELAAG